MEKQVITAEQIRQEVLRRLIQGTPVPGDHLEKSVSLPIAHSPDAEKRNWDMKHDDQDQHNDYIRHVIDEARRDFLLSDSAERDEILGDSFAHS